MFNRILVPLDGSSMAERAIPHAVEFARIFNSTIILLQVLDPISYHENPNPVDPLSWQIRKAEADMYMQSMTARTREYLQKSINNEEKSTNKSNDNFISHVEYSILEGKAAENIVNFARRENIDLLVISTHGASGLSRWNISSVAQKVINMIFLPVLIVRTYMESATEDARIHYRRILLPFDCSRRAECSLSAGIILTDGETAIKPKTVGDSRSVSPSTTETSPLSSKLILAAVIKPPELPIPEPYPIEIEQLSQQLMTVSRLAVTNYLQEMQERIPVDCEFYVLEDDSVTSAIQKLAIQEEDIDLVVLCAHGYSGQFTWPYGSVASNYIEHGTKTVLVIQDVPRSRVQPTAAEIAAEKSGGR
ncbi:MAG TPA: universal stress protein [Anaerolineaceae bacterium]|nr:universal stress protein [Anaerolineaceae bacterium]